MQHQLTRLLVGTLITTEDRDKIAFRDMLEEKLTTALGRMPLYGREDVERMKADDAHWRQVIRQEMERGPDACKTNESREIER